MTTFPLDLTSTAPVPFWRSVRVEFRKSYDTRAGMWLLISIGIVITLIEAVVLVVALVNPGTTHFTDFAYLAALPASLLLPVVAIMLVTSEWSQRGGMVTFALEPRRSRVVLAKWLVSASYALITVVVMFVVALIMSTIYSIGQPDYMHWTGSTDNPVLLNFTVYQVLTMSIGFAFGALLLNTPAAIVLFFVYWYVFPGVLFFVGHINRFFGDTLEWINFQQASSPFIDGTISTGDQWAKLLFSTLLWIGVPLGSGIWRIVRTEVK
ncbi:ABC transporter permease [Nocardioides montaniterrae]